MGWVEGRGLLPSEIEVEVGLGQLSCRAGLLVLIVLPTSVSTHCWCDLRNIICPSQPTEIPYLAQQREGPLRLLGDNVCGVLSLSTPPL